MTHQSHTCYTNAANKTAVPVIVQGIVVMQLMWVDIFASAIITTMVTTIIRISRKMMMILITMMIMMITIVTLSSS